MLEAHTISSDEMQHAQQFAVRPAQDYLRTAKDNVAHFTQPWSDATLCLERAPAFRSGSWRQLRCRLWSRLILHFSKSCELESSSARVAEILRAPTRLHWGVRLQSMMQTRFLTIDSERCHHPPGITASSRTCNCSTESLAGDYCQQQ